MQHINPLNQADLIAQIKLVKLRKKNQEQDLTNCLTNFVSSLSPVSLIKDSIHSLVKDPEVRLDLTNAGVQLGADIVIDMVLGRYRSIKGFVGAVLAEKLITPNITQYVSKWLGHSVKSHV